MILLSLFLQVATDAPATGSGWQSILMMVLIFAVFYFFMIRPQSKKQKEIKKQREAMKAGDRVITSGGIYGKVKEIKDAIVILEIAENVRVKVDKSSVYAAAEDVQTPVK